jgi:hypothetical protein
MTRFHPHLYKGFLCFFSMGALTVQENPFPPSQPYDAGFYLSIVDRLREINARKVFAPGGVRVDWRATDTWRAEGIRELPPPPSGKGYFFSTSKHLVELQAVSEGGYTHVRRPVDADALENDPRNQAKIESARLAAEKREMQEAIMQTRTLLAEKARKAEKRAW